MTIQRKRVAKRLASGLLAGALALGGLAISGGSPASAITPTSPTTNRLGGADRYETAAAIARDQSPACGTSGLVIVSGESTADSLAAASIATATRPMLLVRKDSIPQATADFINDCRDAGDWVSGAPRIYVIGGEAAISAEVFTALGSLVATAGDSTPAAPTRVSGADRYATSAAVAALSMGASDRLIIVNGSDGNWADALAVGPIAAEGGWPILLSNGSGLSDAVKASIDTYAALPGSALSIVIVGGPAAVSPAVESYLVSDAVGFVPANIRRIGGVDRYHTSMLVNVYAATDAAVALLGAFNTDSVALASGTSPWDALTAAGWAAAKSPAVHVHLVPAAGTDTYAQTLIGTAAALNNSTSNQNLQLWLLGGTSVMPNAAKIAASGVATSGNLTSTLSGCVEGATSVTLTLSGRLGAASAGTENATFATAANHYGRFELNGVDRNVTGGSTASMGIVDFGALVTGLASRQTFTITLGAALLEDDVFEFEGWAENSTTDVTGYTPSRTIAGSTCEVADDVTPPTATLARAYPGVVASGATNSAAARIELRFSEPVTLGSSGFIAAGKITKGSVTNSAAARVSAINTTGTAYLVQIASDDLTMTAFAASDVVSLNLDQVVDRGSLNPLSSISMTVGSTDTSAPALTVSAVECTAVGQARVNRGNLTIASTVGGSFDGAAGMGFTLAVNNQRGLEMPSVAIDGAAKTIVVTADVNYHTVADVSTVMANAWLTNALLGNWTVSGSGLLSATVTPVSATLGSSTCVVEISSNEAIVVSNGGATIGGSLGGYATAAVSNEQTLAANTEAFGGSDDAVTIGATVTVTTAVLGTGTLVFATSDGVMNSTGVWVSTPVEFTLA